MDTTNKTAPHLVAATLMIVVGIFLFRFETKEEVLVDNGASLKEMARGVAAIDIYPAEYGFRPYGVAVIAIGAAYIAWMAYKASQNTSE